MLYCSSTIVVIATPVRDNCMRAHRCEPERTVLDTHAGDAARVSACAASVRPNSSLAGDISHRSRPRADFNRSALRRFFHLCLFIFFARFFIVLDARAGCIRSAGATPPPRASAAASALLPPPRLPHRATVPTADRAVDVMACVFEIAHAVAGRASCCKSVGALVPAIASSGRAIALGLGGKAERAITCSPRERWKVDAGCAQKRHAQCTNIFQRPSNKQQGSKHATRMF